MHKLEQKLYAVKKVKLFIREGEDIRQNKLFREVSAMTSLNHSFIVRHHTTWTELPSESTPHEVLIRKSINRKRTYKKRLDDITPVSRNLEHTRISDLGFEWDTGSQQIPEDASQITESDGSQVMDTPTRSRIRTISHFEVLTRHCLYVYMVYRIAL